MKIFSKRPTGIYLAGVVLLVGIAAGLAVWSPFRGASGPNPHPGQEGPQGCATPQTQPPDAPPYPNAQDTRTRNINQAVDGPGNPVFDAGMLVYTQKVTSFKTTDKPETVRAFYVQELLREGWRVNNGTPSPRVHQFYWQPAEGTAGCGTESTGPSTYVLQLDMKVAEGQTEVTLKFGYEKES